jgi:hypothetical protein
MNGMRPQRADMLWVLLSLALRLPLSLLPAPGRDEAVYYIWALQDHGAYAPLMLYTVRVADAWGLSPLLAIRVPALVVGTLLVWAIARHLRCANAPPAWRAVAMAAVVTAPWFVFSGAILHPDAWLAACVVFAATGWTRRSPWAAAGWAAAAPLAKLSGVFIGAVVAILLISDRGETRRRRFAPAALAAAGSAAALLALGPERVDALSTLARLDSTLPPVARAGLLVLLLLTAAPAMVLLATDGVRRAVRSREWTFAVSVAIPWCGWLLLALLTRDQFKANWWLPGVLPLVLLARPLSPRFRMLAWTAAVGGAWISIGMNLALTAPSLVERVTDRLGWGTSYQVVAGDREAAVSGTATWAERAREYRSIDSFVATLAAATGSDAPPARIVTDDYGLAAQLAFAWVDGRIELDVRGDPMQPAPALTEGSTLWLWRSDTWAIRHGAPPGAARLAHPTVAGSEVFAVLGNPEHTK